MISAVNFLLGSSGIVIYTSSSLSLDLQQQEQEWLIAWTILSIPTRVITTDISISKR